MPRSPRRWWGAVVEARKTAPCQPGFTGRPLVADELAEPIDDIHHDLVAHELVGCGRCWSACPRRSGRCCRGRCACGSSRSCDSAITIASADGGLRLTAKKRPRREERGRERFGDFGRRDIGCCRPPTTIGLWSNRARPSPAVPCKCCQTAAGRRLSQLPKIRRRLVDRATEVSPPAPSRLQ